MVPTGVCCGMPDITMCYGDTCPLRQRCYRYRAITAGRQSYFGSLPFDAARGTCDDFWDIARLEPSEDDIRTRAYYLWLAAGCPSGAADDHWARAKSVAAAQGLLRDDLP